MKTQTAAVTGLDRAYVEKIYLLLEKYPKEDDEQITGRLTVDTAVGKN